MNNVTLIGRLTRDPETRYTQSQMAVATFNVAVNRPKPKNENGNQPTADFINCIAFGKTAEIIEKYFNKGKQIALQGRLQNNNYEDKNGNKVYTYNVVAERIEFVGSKEDGQRGDNAQQGNRHEQPADVYEGFSALEDDDVPF